MEETGRFPALHKRDFRLFWIGQIISFSGTWMHSTAQGWLVYSLTRSPLYLGLVAAASSLPVLLLSLAGGVAADRFRKRNLMIVTQGLSVLPALGIGVLTQMGRINVWEVMAFVSFFGIVNAFDMPSRQSFFAELVEKDSLVSAIALNSAALNVARIIGPVIAGFTIAYLGLPACFYLNALSFFAVIIALIMIKSRGTIQTGKKNGLVEDLLAGIRFIRGEGYIRSLLAITGIFSLLAIPFISLLPVFAVEVLKTGPKGLGFLAGSAGLGAFLAAVFLAYRGGPRKQLSFIKTSAVVFPASLLAFSFSKNFFLSMGILVITGWSLVSYLALTNSGIQLKSSDGLRGRVMSVYTLVFIGMAPIGNTLLGAAADLMGTPQALAISSSLCLILSLLMGARLRETLI